MKPKKSLIILLSFLTVLVCVSCDKEDKVDISQLIGKWSVTTDDPRLMIDSHVEYTFKSDMTCTLYTADLLSDRDTTYYYTYVISMHNDLISLYDEEKGRYVEQYYILKLNSKKMKWQSTDNKDKYPNMYLVKVSD